MVYKILQMKVQQYFAHCLECYSISNGNVLAEISQDHIHNYFCILYVSCNPQSSLLCFQLITSATLQELLFPIPWAFTLLTYVSTLFICEFVKHFMKYQFLISV